MGERERVRVLRLIEYDGPADWVQRTLDRSLDGTMHFPLQARITARVLSTDDVLRLPTSIDGEGNEQCTLLDQDRLRTADWPAYNGKVQYIQDHPELFKEPQQS